MGIFEIFGLIFLALISISFVLLVIGIIRKVGYLKNTDNKIKVRNKNTALYYVWIFLSLFNIFNVFMQMTTASEQGDLSRERGYCYFAAVWIMFLIYFVFMLCFGRYSYISENYIITLDLFNSKKSKENCRYKISVYSVEIYYKNRQWKCEIIDSKEELTEMLENNYKIYE